MSKPDGNASAQQITHPFYNLAGISAVSAKLTPFYIPAMVIMIERMRNGKTYWEAGQKLASTPLPNLLNTSLEVFARRFFGSMTPAAFSQYAATHYDLNNLQLMGGNALFESAISGFREPIERFKICHRASFPFIKAGHSLHNIDEKTFNELMPANWTGKKYEDLKILQDQFHTNRLYQAGAVLTRNLLFSSAVFLAKPFATQYVAEHGDDLEKMGIPKDAQQELITTAFRLSFAWMTTPFDRALTQMSSGEVTLSDFLKMTTLKNAFQGAIARSVFCFLTATTIAEGIEFGKNIQEFVETDPALQFISKSLRKAASNSAKTLLRVDQEKTQDPTLLDENDLMLHMLQEIRNSDLPEDSKQVFDSFEKFNTPNIQDDKTEVSNKLLEEYHEAAVSLLKKVGQSPEASNQDVAPQTTAVKSEEVSTPPTTSTLTHKPLFNPLPFVIQQAETSSEQCAKTTIPLLNGFNCAFMKHRFSKPFGNTNHLFNNPLDKLAAKATQSASTETEKRCADNLSQFAESFGKFTARNAAPLQTQRPKTHD